MNHPPWRSHWLQRPWHFLCWLFCAAAALAAPLPRGQVAPFSLFVLEQVERQTLYPVPESALLASSIRKLGGRSFPGPVLLSQYTQILQGEVSRSENPEETLRKAVDGFLEALPDPYARFLSPAEAEEEAREGLGEEFPGFGILLSERDGAVRIAGVLQKSPAAQAKIAPGERLLAVNGRKVSTLRQAFSLLLPREGTPVRLGLLRRGVPREVSLLPGRIRLLPFQAETRGRIGYVRMELLTRGTSSRLLKAIGRFEHSRARTLVLDLRNCLGGDVREAARMAGFFLPQGSVLYWKATRRETKAYRNATGVYHDLPLVVLVNGATASAAELLAGALQDHGRGKLYGETTLGKGTIQGTWILPGGWRLQLTTARYLTPRGKPVDKQGISPDVAWPGGESWERLLKATPQDR